MNPRLRKFLLRNDLLLSLRNHIGFYKVHGRLPRKKAPMTFNDHFFFVKSRILKEPLRVYISDKEFVKTYIRNHVGDDYNIPTIAILRTVDEARDYLSTKITRRCVIKPTHMSGEYLFPKGPLTEDEINIALAWFNQNYFYNAGEVNYRDLTPKIIVEEFVDFDGEAIPKDYKCFCSNGHLVMIQVNEDRFGHERKSLYSPEWEFLPFVVAGDQAAALPRPPLLPEIIKVVESLAKNFGVIRVDLYVSDKKIVVGELTNVHSDACGIFVPSYGDDIVGKVFSDPTLRITDVIRAA